RRDGTGPDRAAAGTGSTADSLGYFAYQAVEVAGLARPGRDEARRAAAGGGVPLVEQRGLGDPPPRADLGEHAAWPHSRAGQEHLAERAAAVHLPERPDLDAGLVHVDEEVGEALVLWQAGI